MNLIGGNRFGCEEGSLHCESEATVSTIEGSLNVETVMMTHSSLNLAKSHTCLVHCKTGAVWCL